MSGFFALLDDIAALMDDVAIMTKVATKKTAGILGDDLAVGAEKASSFRASRELPVIWAITKGSFVNKLIILPFVFLLSAFLPQLIVPILLIGGIYLSFEGVEKIINTFFYKKKHAPAFREIETEAALSAVEKSKIKSAIITDFILSLEIIMIALGTLKNSSLLIQVVVVSLVAVIATIGVYGIVALMVRIDDVGFRLIKISENNKGFFKIIYHEIGTSLVWLLPKLIQLIAIIGTLAMLLVGGGLFVHNISAVHDLFHGIPSVISELIMGLLVGFISFLFFKIGSILKELYKSKM
jgi:predicted DNA repair protein MutK